MLAGTGLLGLIGHILFNRNCKKIETNLREFKIQTFGPFLQNLFCAKPNCLAKLVKMLATFWAILLLFKKNAMVFFEQLLYNLGYFFHPTSGHTLHDVNLN